MKDEVRAAGCLSSSALAVPRGSRLRRLGSAPPRVSLFAICSRLSAFGFPLPWGRSGG